MSARAHERMRTPGHPFVHQSVRICGRNVRAGGRERIRPWSACPFVRTGEACGRICGMPVRVRASVRMCVRACMCACVRAQLRASELASCARAFEPVKAVVRVALACACIDLSTILFTICLKCFVHMSEALYPSRSDILAKETVHPVCSPKRTARGTVGQNHKGHQLGVYPTFHSSTTPFPFRWNAGRPMCRTRSRASPRSLIFATVVVVRYQPSTSPS